MGAIDAKRALALIGVPFRAQGRDRDGLDCVGLCLVAYRLPTDRVRADYRLRGEFRAEVEAFLARHFRRIGNGRQRPGDLMLIEVRADQLHLAVRTERGFVHADAGLRRVVEVPGDPQWPIIGSFRKVRQRARR